MTVPSAGRSVPVLTQAARNKELTLLLLFPNGDRRLVPQSWTDAVPAGKPHPLPSREASLAPLVDLLRFRAVVDALLQRLPADQDTPDSSLVERTVGWYAPGVSRSIPGRSR